MSSFFDNVPEPEPDAIFALQAAASADPQAINLGIGAYRDDNGKPYVLEVVKKAERMIIDDKSLNKEYLGIGGDQRFIQGTQKFCFGPKAKALLEGRIATAQALSGTGALRVGAEFLAHNFPKSKVYVSKPTWGNHFNVFGNAGLSVGEYAYWEPSTKGLNYDGMINDLKAAPNGSIIVLHASGHNPTGVDPSAEQWLGIMNTIREKGHLPFFDAAYIGYASGDFNKDAFAIRLFEENGFEMLVAQSYSKNMGLYGERIGAINVVCKSADIAKVVLGGLKSVIRPMYSNPPKHGAAIAALILNDEKLFQEWTQELAKMVNRIHSMRTGLREALLAQGIDWPFITEQIGMFTFTGLTKEQIAVLKAKHHVYMPNNGRISIAGLTSNSISDLASAIKQVSKL